MERKPFDPYEVDRSARPPKVRSDFRTVHVPVHSPVRPRIIWVIGFGWLVVAIALVVGAMAVDRMLSTVGMLTASAKAKEVETGERMKPERAALVQTVSTWMWVLSLECWATALVLLVTVFFFLVGANWARLLLMAFSWFFCFVAALVGALLNWLAGQVSGGGTPPSGPWFFVLLAWGVFLLGWWRLKREDVKGFYS